MCVKDKTTVIGASSQDPVGSLNRQGTVGPKGSPPVSLGSQ
jgi:hypothetical protein